MRLQTSLFMLQDDIQSIHFQSRLAAVSDHVFSAVV